MDEPIDWPKLLGDLAYLGLTGSDLARASGMGQDAVRRWAKGVRPCEKARPGLERLWCRMTGKPAKFLPRVSPGVTQTMEAIPNLDSNEEQEPAYVQTEAMQQYWHRAIIKKP